MDFKVNNISPQLLKKAKELATNAEKTPGGSITQNEVEQLLKEANKDGKITVSESQFIAGLTSEQNVKKLLQSNFNPINGEIQFQGVSRIRLREIHQKSVTINNANATKISPQERISMSDEELFSRTKEVLQKHLIDNLPEATKEHVRALLTPEVITSMAVLASAYTAAHMFGAPLVADGIAVTALGIGVGTSSYTVAKNVLEAADIISDPHGDLKQAGKKLADAVALVGIDSFLAYTSAKSAQIVSKLKQVSPQAALRYLSSIKSAVKRQGSKALTSLKETFTSLYETLRRPFGVKKVLPEFRLGLNHQQEKILQTVRAEAVENAKLDGVKRNYRDNIKNGFKSVSVAQGTIDGKPINLKGVSGEKNITGFAPGTSENRVLPWDYVNGTARKADGEINILEQLLKQTSADSKGELTILVDRKSCFSCGNLAIPAFNELRPGIKLTIIQGKGQN
ncbi:hypothetical protein COW36_21125 [bacterium (Candidatus Blackallbacteria) CG17_big_fil_post_rev_8_21_14_2_50_48_46]|uniref:Pre-toxin TG domain-containing protein n=1 Tax=bacterium (Candidatus Blackallbacteria) CG17_big_fil_post_rev_8_21_14_2_50_48_46 TaxID=2014261 RepID=A0A2M7FYU6_9BACT|nr:MAG: hypothetical protein COW64_14435 [bacterium (Candidatus Blackallbacteria) CG18_big_fil_WC_8_21_14_2_50_49_26]PIW14543.1 MAG: hypothetical protein COW36_21125 [bacterium (Candidatus Blackallbacteria) CG17_big_fil_post_rev_8_21_14_2_50_48_46]PIW47228.1 MAG: hypothetical protein COW20_13570 [bacterium (Candidatus Blackallbacteria) CG13_big_fil_rev_8_21_14_2_50_49_14]